MRTLFYALALAFSTFAQGATRYDGVIKFTQELHATNPSTTELFELKTSSKPLIGLKIGTGPINQLILGTHHGNEYGATEVTKALMKDLAANPLPNAAVYVIPVVNVSGYNLNERRENGLDPNRDYPGPCGSASGRPFKLSSIKAVSDFMETKQFVMALTLHTYSSVIAYPWSFNYNEPSAHDSELSSLASVAANINGYKAGKTPDLLYTTRGDFESFGFWKFGTWTFLFELGTSHTPSHGDVDEMIQKNVPAMRALLASSPTTRATNHSFSGTCQRGLEDDDLGIE